MCDEREMDMSERDNHLNLDENTYDINNTETAGVIDTIKDYISNTWSYLFPGPKSKDIDIYYLPTYQTGDENGHIFYTCDFEPKTGFIDKFNHFFASADEEFLDSINKNDIIHVHYSNKFDPVNVEDDYASLLKKDRGHHKNLIWFDVACFIAKAPIVIPGTSVPIVYRGYRHYKMMKRTKRAEKIATYESNDFLADLEEIITSAETRKEAYGSALKYTTEHELDDLSMYYEKQLNMSYWDRLKEKYLDRNNIKIIQRPVPEEEDEDASIIPPGCP